MDELHSKPINKTAALVVSKGYAYSSTKKISGTECSIAFPIENTENHKRSNYVDDLAGKRFGRLTAKGICVRTRGMWSCRCDCGMYVLRKAKAVKNPNNKLDCCSECRHLLHLKREAHYRECGKNKDMEHFF